jgi:hypothetical protein
MSNVDLARWQFAFTTVNHFMFVPVTIGLAFLTALLRTTWYRSKRDEYLRLTRSSTEEAGKRDSTSHARPPPQATYWPGDRGYYMRTFRLGCPARGSGGCP